MQSSDEAVDEAMKARILPEVPDLEIESEGVHTWEIENYRNLSKKEHGPIFQVGGHPWCVMPDQPPWDSWKAWGDADPLI